MGETARVEFDKELASRSDSGELEEEEQDFGEFCEDRFVELYGLAWSSAARPLYRTTPRDYFCRLQISVRATRDRWRLNRLVECVYMHRGMRRRLPPGSPAPGAGSAKIIYVELRVGREFL